MRQYYDRSTAPLLFHKFFWWVRLPVGFIFVLVKLVDIFLNGEYRYSNYSVYYAVDIVYFLIIIGLTTACFIGFFRWKAYAWYCMIVYLSVYVVYSVFVVMLYSIMIPFQSAAAVGQFIGASVYSVLIGIYYIKRRPLFFPERKDPYVAAGVGGLAQVSVAGAADPLPRANFCSQCGNVLPEGSNFCSECGTPVRRS